MVQRLPHYAGPTLVAPRASPRRGCSAHQPRVARTRPAIRVARLLTLLGRGRSTAGHGRPDPRGGDAARRCLISLGRASAVRFKSERCDRRIPNVEYSYITTDGD